MAVAVMRVFAIRSVPTAALSECKTAARMVTATTGVVTAAFFTTFTVVALVTCVTAVSTVVAIGFLVEGVGGNGDCENTKSDHEN
jgi:hypothetical protein